MKSINFTTNEITHNQVNEERVDEFFGALLICGLGATLASKGIMSWWGGIQEFRANIAKHKAERAKEKASELDEKNKQLEAKIKRQELEMKRYNMVFGKAIEAGGKDGKLPNGMKFSDYQEVLDRAARGEATDEDIKIIAEQGKRKLTKEEENIKGRVESSASKYSLAEINEYCENHGIPKDMDVEAIAKHMDEHKEAFEKALPPKSENKTEDELRQEIKDKLKDAKDEEIPPSLKDKDGKLDTEKLDKSTGDDLVGLAKDCGVDPVKPQKSGEKPEGETGKEGEAEDEPQDGDERTDNDDELKDMDSDDFENGKDGKLKINIKNPKKNPAVLYKKRHYKRGDKTFTTKNYYSKNGLSITPQEYQDAVDSWNKKNPKKNENWNITKLSSMKSQPVTEAKVTDRIGIIKERLVYIRYVMDTSSKSNEKVAMERMYNALFDVTFNADGTPRSLNDLYSYIDQTMIENKGKIPGLPTEAQIENIDEKVQAFKELHKNEYKAYLKLIDKELLDKSSKKKDDDAAADLLHPGKEESEDKTVNDIRQLSTIYGFTNILGFEPERKPAQQDKENKDEIDKQRRDGDPEANAKDSKDVKADDISDEQIDKIIGVSK